MKYFILAFLMLNAPLWGMERKTRYHEDFDGDLYDTLLRDTKKQKYAFTEQDISEYAAFFYAIQTQRYIIEQREIYKTFHFQSLLTHENYIWAETRVLELLDQFAEKETRADTYQRLFNSNALPAKESMKRETYELLMKYYVLFEDYVTYKDWPPTYAELTQKIELLSKTINFLPKARHSQCLLNKNIVDEAFKRDSSLKTETSREAFYQKIKKNAEVEREKRLNKNLVFNFQPHSANQLNQPFLPNPSFHQSHIENFTQPTAFTLGRSLNFMHQ